MLRLLWLIDSLNVGGAESLVKPFAARLDRTRFDLVVCSLTTTGTNAIEHELRAAGVATYNLGARNLRDVRAFRKLKAFVKEQRIDVVHAHLTYSAIWSSILSRMTGIPAVVSLHVAPSATKEQEKTSLRKMLVDVKDRLMRFLVTRWAQRIVMVSAGLRDDYVKGGGLNPEKIRVVHNGIELERFARDRAATRARLEREFGIAPGAPLVVSVSVLRAAKGMEVLLEAVNHVRDATFLIVGDGPMREEWSKLAQTNGIADRVRWAGYRTDVDALLAGCDLFVHPSLNDAFPTVLLEAMAAGLPVVASRVGGIPEIVEPDVTGTLVPAGNAAELARAINAALSDREQLQRMRETARERATSRFSTDAWIGRLATVYDEVRA